LRAQEPGLLDGEHGRELGLLGIPMRLECIQDRTGFRELAALATNRHRFNQLGAHEVAASELVGLRNPLESVFPPPEQHQKGNDSKARPGKLLALAELARPRLDFVAHLERLAPQIRILKKHGEVPDRAEPREMQSRVPGPLDRPLEQQARLGEPPLIQDAD
jgi:hypothetical protein